MRAKAYTDGGGNRGYAGACACVIIDEETGQIFEHSFFLGDVSNNEAEYEGVYLALRFSRLLGVTDLIIHSDSQLIVNQLRGTFKVLQPHLLPYREKCRRLASSFDSVDIQWIPREQNKHADKLCRETVKTFSTL